MPLRFRPLSLLLIDDNESTRRAGARLLEDAGHQVAAVPSVEAAERLLVERRFDCVLIEGQQASIDAANARVPVVVVTAADVPGDRRRDQLAAALLGCGLRLLREPVMLPSQLRFVDALRGVQMESGESLIAHVARLLVEQMPERFVALQRTLHLPAPDRQRGAAALAHRMAGSAASIGASELCAHLQEVERTASLGRAELERAIALAADVWRLLEPHVLALADIEEPSP